MSVIFELLNSAMNRMFFLIGDWGIVIVLATLVIRLCLLPLSLRQKRSISEQQVFSGKLEEIKQRYSEDKEKQQQEIARLSAENMKSMAGCLVTLIQLPVMYILYRVFSDMPIQVGSVLVPWISNLKLPDALHIVPVIAVLIQMLPGIIAAYTPVKGAKQNGMGWPQLLLMGGMSMLFFVKAPVTLGIYWVTSGLFSILEVVLFNRFFKRLPA
ncbi:membrane protein insertase YidC [Ruminiclostridium hungatei]|uniref:Membrane protein insertase YidC n=1 Tax=Ruminiclostridium hungatei TaxID=48256 RepID=A0A1V4SGN0_RUMHU|nr:YidC/Oxa1 family membrane protein insertase [Ruminiclostridium hungatei]OPX42625.1 membrane protein insertase YidC [Ruminiclostridium hungatei]